MKAIAIVAHKFLTQPDDELVYYINNNRAAEVMHIMHAFSDEKHRRSYYKHYKEGELIGEGSSRDWIGWPEPVIYLKELWCTFLWLGRTKFRWDIYIGMDGLCVLFGNMLRLVRKVRKTIFWAIDFVPEKRFKSNLKNNIYESINVSGYKRSDEMWDLSPRMAEARRKFIGLSSISYRKHKVVPLGAWVDRIRKYSFNDCDKSTLVFMGHLIEKQGVQFIIECLPELIKLVPGIKLKIIGDGIFKKQLQSLADNLQVMEACTFMGKIPDHKDLENEVAKCAIAIAPYIKELDTWTKYADPGKVKAYLSCGVPIILTDIPWNAAEINSYAGIVINEDPHDLVTAILKLLEPTLNQEYRNNAIAYARSFDYQTIFKKVIEDLNTIND